MERRLETIAKKGAISFVSPGCGDTNKTPTKIILHGGSRIVIYCPITGQVFEQEEAGSLPAPNIPIEPPSDPHEPTISTHSYAHSNLQSVAVENEVSSSVGVNENENINESISGAESNDNPNSTSSQDPIGVSGDKDEVAVPPVPTVEHTTGDKD